MISWPHIAVVTYFFTAVLLSSYFLNFFFFATFFIPSYISFYLVKTLVRMNKTKPFTAFLQFSGVLLAVYWIWIIFGYSISRIQARTAEDGSEYAWGLPLFGISYFFWLYMGGFKFLYPNTKSPVI